MARPKTLNVDQQIQRIAEQLKARIDTLRAEVDDLSEKYERLTGAAPSTNGRHARKSIRGVESGGQRKKRIRRQGVDVGWISGHLKSKPMTLKQLQAVAQKEGRSALSVMNVLRTNQSKFKSSEGTKEAGVRGRAAQVWSVK